VIIKFFEDGQWFITRTRHPEDYSQNQEITIDDTLVTIDTLIQIWEQDLEGGNYHSMMRVPSSLVTVLRTHAASDDLIKRTLWDIIEAGGWM
jgi:hypothetical protein